MKVSEVEVQKLKQHLAQPGDKEGKADDTSTATPGAAEAADDDDGVWPKVTPGPTVALDANGDDIFSESMV